jgi:hypothetical protein
MVINNTVGLAKAVNAFGVPTVLTAVIAERGGVIFPQSVRVGAATAEQTGAEAGVMP